MNPEMTGHKVGELEVMNSSELEDFCKENKPVAAILCIPKDEAAKETERLINCGIKAFWNFTHYDLRLNYHGVIVENVHLGDSLTTLSYGLNTMDEK